MELERLKKYENISYELYEKMKRIYEQYGNEDATHSPESIFMYQNDINTNLLIGENIYSVTSNEENDAYYFPVGAEEEKKKFIEQIIDTDYQLIATTEKDIAFIMKYFPDMFVFDYAMEESEYIYDKEDLANMKGKKYANARKDYNYYHNHYQYEIVEITKENINIISNIYNKWMENHDESELIDKEMIDLLIQYAPIMNFKGIYFYIDGKPEAYIIGFQNSPRMFDMFSMKFIHPLIGQGVTAIIELTKKLDDVITLVNLEEDMGLHGLRIMKKRLNPMKLISMYKLKEMRIIV